MPELPLEKWNMWVFQREEGSVAGNIADKLEKSGEYEQKGRRIIQVHCFNLLICK
ncbi:MAG: hypothetical protein V8S84_09215 [Lachnospiraceae bacterium]